MANSMCFNCIRLIPILSLESKQWLVLNTANGRYTLRPGEQFSVPYHTETSLRLHYIEEGGSLYLLLLALMKLLELICRWIFLVCEKMALQQSIFPADLYRLFQLWVPTERLWLAVVRQFSVHGHVPVVFAQFKSARRNRALRDATENDSWCSWVKRWLGVDDSTRLFSNDKKGLPIPSVSPSNLLFRQITNFDL